MGSARSMLWEQMFIRALFLVYNASLFQWSSALAFMGDTVSRSHQLGDSHIGDLDSML